MRASVVRLWQDGKLVPRWQLSYLKPVIGELQLGEGKDEHLRRNLRTAHLIDFSLAPNCGKSLDAIPPLVDAAVLWILDSRMTISGFERGELMLTVAQTWLVELLPNE